MNVGIRSIPLDRLGRVESAEYPGFYYPKGIKGLLVSIDGKVLCQDTKRLLNVTVGSHGYLNVKKTEQIENKKVRLTFLIHRLVSFAFIDVPVKYLSIKQNKIQVNHRDGNKLNNSIDNLEFCIAKENMRHAFSNSLIGIGKRVLVKDIRSCSIEEFPSIAACALKYEIPSITLRRHLSSPFAGLKTKDWRVFKYDDGKPWPFIDHKLSTSDSLYLTSIVIAKNESLNKTVFFSTIKLACERLGLDIISVKNSRQKNGVKHPYCGWVFSECDTSEVIDVNKVIFERSKFGRESEKYTVVTNLLTGETTYYKGFIDMAKRLDYSTIHLSNSLTSGNGVTVIGNYKIRLVSEIEYQGQAGITLPIV